MTNAYSLIHGTFPDQHNRDVRNTFAQVSRALAARYDFMLYQKTNLSGNQTEIICALITSPFDYSNISGMVDSISSNKTKLKKFYDIEKRRIFLNITGLESPSIFSGYEEEEGYHPLQRNETEDENLVETSKVKIEAVSYLKFMVKHSKKLIPGINRREMEKESAINALK